MVCIYALRCPVSGVTRYIGKTKNIKTRLAAHVSKAKSHQTDHHCAHWIRSLLDRGMKPEMFVVAEVPDGVDWQSAEAEAIKACRAAGHDLTNLTGGGLGFRDAQPEVLKRRGQTRSLALSDPSTRAEFVRRMNNSRASATVRRKQSDGLRAAWLDPEKKARIMAGMREPAARKRRAEATRRRMADPVIAAKHKADVRQRFMAPAGREQLRLAREKRWREYRERQPETSSR